MAWHLTPGQLGGLTTGTLPSVAKKIDNGSLQKGDLLDDVSDGHAVLFEAWAPDHLHFSYYSFGTTPMRHYNGGSGDHEGPLGSFSSNIASWPASHYVAYQYDNIVDDTVVTPRSIAVGDIDNDGKTI